MSDEHDPRDDEEDVVPDEHGDAPEEEAARAPADTAPAAQPRDGGRDTTA